MRGNNRDTVEEFWDADTLALCRERSRHTKPQDFLDAFRAFLGATGNVWAFDSARSALRALLAGKSGAVLVCSFNCRYVADAVQEAGLRVETYDLAGADGRFEWEAVRVQPHHVAVVVPHLFGVPTNFVKLHGTMVIEDCAHTLGGKIGSRTAGTIGDAAIFSFNYDKPISLGGGGLLLVKDAKLKFPEPSIGDEWAEMMQFRKFLKDRRGAIHKRYRRGERYREMVFKPREETQQPQASGIGPLRTALGLHQLERYRKIVEKRNANAALFRGWHVEPDVTPAWLRQRVIPKDLKRCSVELQRQGIRAGNFNWQVTIDEHLGLPERPNAATAAHTGMDVPIHQNMTAKALHKIQRVLDGE